MKRYVVLDIDNTLLHARPYDIEEGISKDGRNFYIYPTSIQTILKVTIRKHFNHFIDQLYKKGYGVIIWSAGSPSYVKSLTSVLFANRELEYVFTSEHLTDGRKKLTSMAKFIPDFDIERVKLVDDNPGHAVGQERHVHVIQPFSVSDDGRDDDELLFELADKLFS